MRFEDKRLSGRWDTLLVSDREGTRLQPSCRPLCFRKGSKMTEKSRTAVGSSATGNLSNASQDAPGDVLTPIKHKLTKLFILDRDVSEAMFESAGTDKPTPEQMRKWANKFRAYAWQVESAAKLLEANKPALIGLTRQMLEQN